MSKKENKFITEFRARYDKATEAEYGSAALSRVERQGLKSLYLRAKKELSGQLTSNNASNRLKIRRKVVEYLIEDGWPIEMVANPQDLAETALFHACVVAEALITERGIAASAETTWSYAMKDAFDRFTQKTLVNAGRLGPKSRLGTEWFSPQNRLSRTKNTRVKYPKKVDSSKIYGIGKPHRYWPAQLMRNLEAIRLGEMSDKQLADWQLTGLDKKKCTIPWVALKPAILAGQSTNEICVNILIQVISILKQRNMSEKHIIEIVLNSYSPRGMILEHGAIPQITEIWGQLLSTVRKHKQLQNMYPQLLKGVQTRFQEAGVDFTII